MTFACEVGRAGNKLFTDTLATMLQRRGYRTAAFVSAFTLDSRFGLDAGFDVYDDGFDADDIARLLCNEKTASVAVKRATEAMADIRFLRRVAEFG